MTHRHRLVAVTVRMIAIASLACGARSGFAADLDAIKARGWIGVGVAADGSRCSVPHLSETFEAGLLRRWQTELGVELRTTKLPYHELAAALEDGRIDLAADCLQITMALQRSLAFGPPLVETTLAVMTRVGDAPEGLAALGGKRFAVRQAPEMIMELQQLEHQTAEAGGVLGESVAVPDVQAALAALEHHDVDYVVGPLSDLSLLVASAPDKAVFGATVGPRTFASWAVGAGNIALADQLGRFVDALKKSGDLASLQLEAFHRRFDDLPEAVVATDWWQNRKDRPKVFPIPVQKVQD